MIKPQVRISLTFVREFYYKWDSGAFPYIRMGQAFYNEFNLHKMQQDREWFDSLYNSDGVVAINMINSITDFSQ